MDALADRLPPQNLQAEQATLGACLIDEEALVRARAIVAEADFYREAHREIWAAICSVADAREPVDPVTVGAALRSRGKLAAVGGGEYLNALIGEVVTTAHTVRYATIVAQAGLLRNLIRAAADLQRDCYEYPDDPAPVLAAHMKRIAELSQGRTASKGARLVGETADDLIHELEQRMEEVPHVAPQRTGIAELDKRTGGLKGHTLVVARGEEKAGKSMFCAQCLLATAVEFQKQGADLCCVAYILEGQDIWLERALGWLGRFNSNVFTPTTSALALEHSGFRRAAQLWRDLPLYLSGAVADIDAIVADVQRINMQHQVGMVLVDYAQLIRGGPSGRELEKIEYRANALASLGAELRCPVIVPSQVTQHDGEAHAKGARVWDESASWSFDVVRGHRGDDRVTRQRATHGELRHHGCRRRAPFFSFPVTYELATGHILFDPAGMVDGE